LHIKNKQKLVPACLIRLKVGVERLVPIEVTNLAIAAPTVFPLPVDLSSLHNLNQTFRCIQAQLERECKDDPAQNEQPTPEQYHSETGVGNPDRSTTANNPANDGQGLPKPGRPMETGGRL
jgi:hypothetical protein